MTKPIKISIPTPCHENWNSMTPADKGRFCASCQKNVYDFTRSSDREIASILKNTKNACGRFTANQLNRDLVVPKEKSSIWMAASAAVVSFLTIGITESFAQQNTIQQPTHSKNKKNIPTVTTEDLVLEGKIIDTDSVSIPGAYIRIIRTNKVIETDSDGNFKLTTKKNDKLEISFTGMLTKYITITEERSLKIVLEHDPQIASNIDITVYRETMRCTTGAAVITVTQSYTESRTFLGRIFHSIGNIFR